MNRLLDIGFELSGHWFVSDGRLDFKLARNATRSNILYAFVNDGEVLYVGKTVRTLGRRLCPDMAFECLIAGASAHDAV